MFDELTAICGPSCAGYPAYIATLNHDREGLSRIATEWTQALKRNFTPDDIICDGCRVPGGRRSAYWATCDIRNCAQSKGHITCAHCAACPCEKIVAPLARECLADLKKSLPDVR
ncbi:MAG: hypothetical protein A2Z29_01015 [Chloroflexi bacterium RBG_16_56_11]|nr:MAG: hypothetical protein A2Z29_01015 [Chloroflexi bacterium RBG_16_56_11]